MSGRKPRILQFASDGQVGTQHTCCVDKFDGDLHDLIRLCGRVPDAVDTPAVHALPAGPEFAPGVLAADALVGTNGYNGAPTPPAPPQPGGYPAEAYPVGLTAAEQRELLTLLREQARYRPDTPATSPDADLSGDATGTGRVWSGEGDLPFSLLERLAISYGDRQAIALLKQVARAAEYPERQADAQRAASILQMASTARKLN